jgi:hypothetical protein
MNSCADLACFAFFAQFDHVEGQFLFKIEELVLSIEGDALRVELRQSVWQFTLWNVVICYPF